MRRNGVLPMGVGRRIGLQRRGTATVWSAVWAIGLLVSCSPGPQFHEPWFGGYAYLTPSPRYELDERKPGVGGMILSFVVAAERGSCTPSWGDAGSLENASREFRLEQQVAGLHHEGGTVAISFGGASGDELATACSDVDKLHEAYGDVLRRYQIDIADFDVEMDDLGLDDANARRADALARLQGERGPEDPLEVWLTLPVTPEGLGPDAADVVAQTLEGDVDLTGVNLMTMSFGSGRQAGESMADTAESAAHAVHGQLKTFYSDAGVELSDEQVWNRIGLTPMIGQNDVPGEVFSMTDAEQLNEFAHEKGLGRLSFWALNRDRQCPVSERAQVRASLECSGVQQDAGEFTEVLSQGFR